MPPPPEIGDKENLRTNRHAYFNRLTLTGIDKFPNYRVDGQNYTALDYLQFLNPSDLRVLSAGRSCANCHSDHAEVVASSMMATEAGVLSGGTYAIGVSTRWPESVGRYIDTAADLGFRDVQDTNFVQALARTGAVSRLIESRCSAR